MAKPLCGVNPSPQQNEMRFTGNAMEGFAYIFAVTFCTTGHSL